MSPRSLISVFFICLIMAVIGKCDQVKQQQDFMLDVAYLIRYCSINSIGVTGGELYRSKEQQKIHFKRGLSTVKRSHHQDRKAIDLNFFFNGKLSYKKKDIQHIADYWKSMNPNNYWGGDFKTLHDPVHFGRK